MGELYMELNSRDTWERARMMRSSAQAQAAGEDCLTAPVTPCPSFASSEWSVSSSSVLVSPVSVSDPSFPDVQVRRRVDEHMMSRSLGSEYLETVPEEGEDGIKQQPPAEEGHMKEEDAPLWHPLNQEPEIGTLEYDYVQFEGSDDDDGNEDAHGSGSEAAEAAPKPRINRFSLPVMQFSWPDA
ncbi:hypothetical protein NLG97_g9399 [Lecanicillium saksenae]|uniref:Uncharacterized protein n=1 Tax=Lecanicillium saksenae TaxID=468837 RepID=A0ACC1QHT9_9HYPO|nr:hypothetical protein NLG97_g9399 [Lecanicillium saksenae]